MKQQSRPWSWGPGPGRRHLPRLGWAQVTTCPGLCVCSLVTHLFDSRSCWSGPTTSRSWASHSSGKSLLEASRGAGRGLPHTEPHPLPLAVEDVGGPTWAATSRIVALWLIHSFKICRANPLLRMALLCSFHGVCREGVLRGDPRKKKVTLDFECHALVKLKNSHIAAFSSLLERSWFE